ncbi:hypothetical protein imdm_1303 [gamma proteobacterium IMCC2047]|nr:hypothetical protein imdm_1303 [gamma proteobacterium IMCC2047]
MQQYYQSLKAFWGSGYTRYLVTLLLQFFYGDHALRLES